MSDPTTQTTALPTGTATFVFTDIEGSTRLVQEVGIERWRLILEQHHALLREVWQEFGGHEVNTEGDAFFVAFPSAANAVAACAQAERRLAAHEWEKGVAIRVRMGIHTGEAVVTAAADYLGIDVHRAARIASAGHGGQVLVSETTFALVKGSMPEGVSMLDLGLHRLKDLVRPEHIYQLQGEGLAAEFPALKSLDATPNNLPTQVTTFVGREEELAKAHELLHTVRLLTLTGPGGTGKTRLSVQLAAEVAHEFEGVYWVPLAPLVDPELVPTTIAQSVGLRESGQKTPVEMIIESLAAKKVLLVLDNFEQVLSAAPAVGEILRGAPQVKIITSSRAPLRVYGEQEFPVPPLGVPDTSNLPPLESLSQYAAVKLFIDRAASIKPDFHIDSENAPAVAAITELVDGLPLAVELAAARIRLLSPRAMLARLENSLGDLGAGARDLPARQQTLRGAIAWSYDMLDAPTQRLMRRFGTFGRGATLEHAEQVCGPAEEVGVDVLTGLEQLVEQSLLRSLDDGPEPRFLMLHVIREFAQDRLKESGEETEVRERHAQAFLAHAETAAGELTGTNQATWLDRLEAEQDNLRGALSWWLSRADAPPAMRMVIALWRFWQMRGHLREGRERIDQVLAMDLPADLVREQMMVNEAGGGVAWWQGEMPPCRAYYRRAIELAREMGDERALATQLYNMSFPQTEGDPAGARVTAEESLRLFEKIGDEIGAARARFSLAGLAIASSESKRSVDLARGAIPIFRDNGLQFDLIWALHTEGLALIKLGRLDESRAALDEALKLLLDASDYPGMTILLGDYSDLAMARGDNARASQLRGASMALQARTGASLEGAMAPIYNMRGFLGRDPSPEEQKAMELGLAMTPEASAEFALSS